MIDHMIFRIDERDVDTLILNECVHGCPGKPEYGSNFFNPFLVTGHFLYPLKTENLWFSEVFRENRKRPVT